MTRRLARRIAFSLVALLMFSQGAVALAACAMDRGQPVTEAAEPCMEHMPSSGDAAPHAMQHGNLCAAHCTADLQAFAMPVALLRAPADAPVLLVAPFQRASVDRPASEAPPPRGVPPRILLHSFLI
jgi:hypothetical protein